MLLNVLDKMLKSSTIIFIAHKLETFINLDELIVMGNGTILERGNPKQLLKNSESEFYKLV